MEAAAEKLYMKTEWLVAQIIRISVPRWSPAFQMQNRISDCFCPIFQ